jgi:hypothetical protein
MGVTIYVLVSPVGRHLCHASSMLFAVFDFRGVDPMALNTNRRVAVVPAGIAGIQRPGRAVTTRGLTGQSSSFGWQSLTEQAPGKRQDVLRVWVEPSSPLNLR